VVGRRFTANRRGVFLVRLSCVWGARCRGWFEGFHREAPGLYAPPRVAVSQYSIPAGKTTTVPIALTPVGLKSLKRHHKLSIGIELWARRANGHLVYLGEYQPFAVVQRS
jgi:hypothetical protein